MSGHLGANVERFSGFADGYDSNRPQPPIAFVEMLTQSIGMERPRLVVDLGCGTGLSTSIWAGRATEIVGIEPNADMIAKAELRRAGIPGGASIAYRRGFSHETGLPDASADIITCSQSFHWMEPAATLAEVARVLRPGGIFATCDCDWPPVINWRAEAAYEKFMNAARELEDIIPGHDVRKWPKEKHLANIISSGKFRYAREIVLHHEEWGNGDRLVGLALSQGGIVTLLKRGMSERELGLEELRAGAEEYIGPEPVRWYFCYRVRIGIR